MPIIMCYYLSCGASGKELTCQCRRHKRLGFNPLIRKIPWRRAQQPTLVPGESHGHGSLAGCSSQGGKSLTRLSMHTKFEKRRSPSQYFPFGQDRMGTLIHIPPRLHTVMEENSSKKDHCWLLKKGKQILGNQKLPSTFYFPRVNDISLLHTRYLASIVIVEGRLHSRTARLQEEEHSFS